MEVNIILICCQAIDNELLVQKDTLEASTQAIDAAQ